MEKEKNIKNILEIRNLVKHFGDNEVLNGFNMRLNEGENLVIMGKSGSGKSVMIKCLMGLMQPDSGHIEIMGKKVLELEQAELDVLRKKIGFLFQGSALYDSMTVKDNLEFPLRKQH
ncbi:MAG: ATP-binding cassette domain-containing protein, partial [Flavobacteriaceae bacterium]